MGRLLNHLLLRREYLIRALRLVHRRLLQLLVELEHLLQPLRKSLPRLAGHFEVVTAD